MPKGRQPRGVTPCPKSGEAAKSARLQWRRNGQEELPKSKVRGSGQEELPHFRGQGWWPRGATPRPKSGAEAERSYPTPEARGSGRENQPHVQRAVAVWAQEGL